MRRSLFVFVFLALALVLAACGGGGGEEAGGQDAQVAAGATVWEASCARCHEGGVGGPELTADLIGSFADPQALYDYVHTNMPLDNPGSLSEQQYWDVTAYMLNEHGLLEEGQVLGQ